MMLMILYLFIIIALNEIVPTVYSQQEAVAKALSHHLQQQQQQQQHSQAIGHGLHGVSNNTIAGTEIGCPFTTNYETTHQVHFPMCLGHKDQELKNGMSIINLITSRGYLPTCRVMQLMLWMSSEVHDSKVLQREAFIDIGANIGSCTVHMASLGFPVVSVEPVKEHVAAIQGSIDINPSFNIDLNHNGISSEERLIHANFGHGARNWGASEFHEANASANESFELELGLKTFDQVVGHRKMSLVKIDCEGCEWEALKGARKTLHRIPMIKLEVVQTSYSSGNETISAAQLLQFLQNNGFKLFVDKWAENRLYFGNHGNEVLDIDHFFGSTKFKLKSNVSMLESSAKSILLSQFDAFSFNREQFLQGATDVIAIEESLSEKMKARFLNP